MTTKVCLILNLNLRTRARRLTNTRYLEDTDPGVGRIDITDEDALLAPTIVRGFSLSDKLWRTSVPMSCNLNSIGIEATSHSRI